MRYAIDMLVAILLIAAGAIFVWHTKRDIQEQFRQGLQRAKAAGQLLPELPDKPIEDLDYRDFDMKLTQGMQVRLDIADLLADFAWFLVPLIIGLCCGVAWLVGRIRLRGGGSC